MKQIGNFFKKIFIPNEDNDYRAKALQHGFLTGYLIFALVLAFSFKYADNHFSNVLGFATDIKVNKLYQLTNKERKKYHLPTLRYNDRLAKAAYNKAEDMFQKNYWAHYAPDGKAPWDFILASNYKYEYAGENLAKNFLFSQGVVKAWMQSEKHKENIIRPEYTDVGFAVVNGLLNGEETTLVVQMFGREESSPVIAKKEYPQVAKSVIAKEPVRVLGTNKAQQNKGNIFKVPYDLNIIFFIFLLFALGIDLYFAKNFKLSRTNGKNIIHFIFIFSVLISLLIIAKGAII